MKKSSKSRRPARMFKSPALVALVFVVAGMLSACGGAGAPKVWVGKTRAEFQVDRSDCLAVAQTIIEQWQSHVRSITPLYQADPSMAAGGVLGIAMGNAQTRNAADTAFSNCMKARGWRLQNQNEE